MKTKTLIIVILDESGSMDTKKADIIKGFNKFLQEQKALEGDVAYLSFVKFNTIISVVHGCEPLNNVQELSNDNFKPGGATALYDAIAQGVDLADKKATDFDRFVCAILTDGEENSSKTATKEKIRELIKKKKATGNWTFIYIGVDPEKFEAMAEMPAGNAIAFNHQEQGNNFALMSSAMTVCRSSRLMAQARVFSAVTIKQEKEDEDPQLANNGEPPKKVSRMETGGAPSSGAIPLPPIPRKGMTPLPPIPPKN